VGLNLFDAFPALKGSEFEATVRRALSERIPLSCTATFDGAVGERAYRVHAVPQGAQEGVLVLFERPEKLLSSRGPHS
jgi:hypothetical protein